jgi:hypothetical protein
MTKKMPIKIHSLDNVYIVAESLEKQSIQYGDIELSTSFN